MEKNDEKIRDAGWILLPVRAWLRLVAASESTARNREITFIVKYFWNTCLEHPHPVTFSRVHVPITDEIYDPNILAANMDQNTFPRYWSPHFINSTPSDETLLRNFQHVQVISSTPYFPAWHLVQIGKINPLHMHVCAEGNPSGAMSVNNPTNDWDTFHTNGRFNVTTKVKQIIATKFNKCTKKPIRCEHDCNSRPCLSKQKTTEVPAAVNGTIFRKLHGWI